ncbi:MAG: hypothetical protein ACLQB1_09055 [Streptosporangiaceae bacterium]
MKNIVSASTSTHANHSSPAATESAATRLTPRPGDQGRRCDGLRDSLVPVRRAFPAQALVIVLLGSLTPADAGSFLALRRQRRLVVGVRSDNPVIPPPGPGWRVRPAADLTSAGFLIPGVSGDHGPPAAGTFDSAAGRPRLFS